MNSDANTLVILTPGFPVSETDSVCLPMQQSLLHHLKELDPSLNIIVLTFQYPYHTETYKWFGNTVTSFNGQNKGGLSKLLLRKKINAVLDQINKDHKITGLLSLWYGECALIGKRFAGKHNLKHFCWILGRDATKENKYPKQLAARPGELIALSDFLQDEFEKNHHTRPEHLIPSGGYGNAETIEASGKNIDIIGAGSLIPLKQYDIFLEVIAALKKQLPEIKAVLAGDGPEKEKLQSLVVQYGLQKNCILTGELQHNKLLELMQGSKILLHTSSYEGFSGVCQEALYSSAHVISFCRAMKQEIEQWHIVNNKDAMTEKALAILQDRHTVYKSIDPFPMRDTAKKMMELFLR